MPALFTKPTQTPGLLGPIPRWADTGVIVEPAEGKKDVGWVTLEKPPASFFNWLGNRTGRWFKWIDERLFDGATADDFIIKHPGTATTTIEVLTDGVRLADTKGLVVGSNTELPVADVIKLGDGNFRMDFNAGSPRVRFSLTGGFNGFHFNRLPAPQFLDVFIDGGAMTRFKGDDVIIKGGLFVGDDTLGLTPGDNQVLVGDAEFGLIHGTTPQLRFETTGGFSGVQFVRGLDVMHFSVLGVSEALLGATGLQVANGLRVGFTGDPANDQIQIGDADFFLGISGGLVSWQAEIGGFIRYTRGSNLWEVFTPVSGAVPRLSISDTLIDANLPIHIGDAAIADIGGLANVAHPSASEFPTLNRNTLIGSYGFIGGTGTVLSGYNIESASRTTNLYTIVHDQDMALANAPVIVSAFAISDVLAVWESTTAASFTVRVYDASSGADPGAGNGALSFIRMRGHVD